MKMLAVIFVVLFTFSLSVEAQQSKSYISGDIAVKGQLLFDGKPLSNFTDVNPRVRLYSSKLQEWFNPKFEYDTTTGLLAIYVISEGSYSGNIKVDANSANPDQYPGDYESAPFSLSASKKFSPTININMEKIIHLIEPVDNGKVIIDWNASCGEKTSFKSPVHIKWEPIGKGIFYTYKIIRVECHPFALREMVAGDVIKETEISVALPPNKEGEIYLLELSAKKEGRKIGLLMTHGINGWGWDYRFRVTK